MGLAGACSPSLRTAPQRRQTQAGHRGVQGRKEGCCEQGQQREQEIGVPEAGEVRWGGERDGKKAEGRTGKGLLDRDDNHRQFMDHG